MNCKSSFGIFWRSAPFAILCILTIFTGNVLGKEYRIEPLTFGPLAINNRGAILSQATFEDGRWRIRIYEGAVIRELPSPEHAYEVTANALNDDGWAVGSSSMTDGSRFATIFTDSGALVIGETIQRGLVVQTKPRKVTDKSPVICSEALAINQSGDTVGLYCAGNRGVRAYVSNSSGIRDLGSLGGNQANATAINNLGHIAGWSRITGGSAHMFLHTPNGVMNLGSLDGQSILPVAINDRGEIAGWGDAPNGGMHVFIYRNNSLIDLGCPEDGRCIAKAMSAEGHIVGGVTVDLEDGKTQDHSFLYADGQFTYIEDMLSNGEGWTGLDPVGINDVGQIVGVGNYRGMGTGFVLHPLQ